MKNPKSITAAAKLIGKIIEPENWGIWAAKQTFHYSVSAYLINGMRLEPDGQIVMLGLRQEIASDCQLDNRIHQDEIRDLTKYVETDFFSKCEFSEI